VLACVLGLVAIAYAASSLAAERGWLPVIALAGARDSARAVLTLRELMHLYEVALQHTEVDAATRDFLKRTTSSLQDFNLRRLYELLPEKNGRFHQLSVAASFSAEKYLISQHSDKQFEIGPESTRHNLGDASLVVRVAPVAARDGDTNYLMQGRVGIVVGQIDWPMIIDAAQEFLRLLGSAGADPAARPMVALRQATLAHNPKLGAEDIEPVATLWEAFPHTGYLLNSLGSIDDLLTADALASADARHVRAVLHADPQHMKEHYPELASYLQHLDRLVEADLRWLDVHGRTFALLHLDSRHLSARLELVEKDGLLVPSRGSTVLLDEPIEASPGVFPYSVRVSASVHLFGVRSQVRAVRLDFEHERTERGMALRGRMQQLPTVTVSGAALGIIPTGVIDAFIPGDIQGLIEKSLQTACQGNDGKGIELNARFDGQPSTSATITGALAFEAIDNFLVKLGVGYFTEHVLPNDDVRADIKRLTSDIHSAFSADLEHYARAHKPTKL
jgi:hypothetical protein